MSVRPGLGLCAGASLAVCLVASPAAARKRAPGPVHYRVSIPAPTTRYVHVELELPDARAAHTRVAMPAWTPGSYLIRDFGKHVYNFEARARGEDGRCAAPLAVERVDKQTWVVANAGKGFCAGYEVFANELSVRTSYLDDRFAFLNGTSIFMYIEGETERAASVALELPSGWPAHTALELDPDAGPLRYRAPSYDALVDSPLLLGEAEVRTFEVAGKALEYVYLAPAGSDASVDRLARDAEIVVRSYARMLGGLPFEHYSFLMIGDAAGGGGLEHRDSTGMIIDPWGFASGSGYAAAQRLVAHEFFHLWNVKRIHDEVLGPFDYTQENYTELLWFHEGLTETMETRSLLRAGVLSPEDYLRKLESAWTVYLRQAGRNHTPIASLSREAWIKAYQGEVNHSETAISYYSKGDLIGVCLDLSLRLRARAKHSGGSLEGLFRRLWAQRDPLTGEAAITIDDIVAAASAEAGEDMRWFFDRYVYGTEELPLPALLEQAGFEVGSELASGADAVWSGMQGYASVSAVAPGSPAAAAGIMHGDELIAVDGARVTRVEEANARLRGLGLGASATISLFRRERLLELALTTAANPNPRAWFELPDPSTDDLELGLLRDQWLTTHLDP